MIEWTKPNGSKITINETEASIRQAVELGWTRLEEAKKDDDSTSDSKRNSRKTRR